MEAWQEREMGGRVVVAAGGSARQQARRRGMKYSRRARSAVMRVLVR